jgi:squalene synthase HpnC
MNSTKQLAEDHYENFPVGSFLFPKEIRQDIFNIYAFSRTADDIVDEGLFSKEERVIQLDNYRSDFLNKKYIKYPFFEAVHHSIESKNLDLHLFIDLLDAFEQDIHKLSYESLSEIENYAKKSANPVGRLMLQLFNLRDEELYDFSDKICSGLQFINFWQDLSRDKEINRYYVPTDLLSKYGLSIDEFYHSQSLTSKHKELVDELILWTEQNFIDGYELINKLSGRFKLEIKVTWLGGFEILKRSKVMSEHLLFSRPKLSKFSFIKLFIYALVK